MRRTRTGVRAGRGARVETLASDRPELRLWLELLARVEDAMEGRAWSPASVRLQMTDDRHPAAAPRLDGAIVALTNGGPGRLLADLLQTAQRQDPRRDRRTAVMTPLPPRAAVRSIEAVLRDDGRALHELADAHQIDPGPFRVIAGFAALPLLHACAKQLDVEHGGWPWGYCPVCGGWPILAEVRGLDRARHARCGRCGSGWPVTVLRCLYCGESDHRRLGSLVREDDRETVRIESCRTCGGFLKVMTTLGPIPPLELWLRDLETVELDLAAIDRGHRRPDGSGHPLRIRIVEHADGGGTPTAEE